MNLEGPHTLHCHIITGMSGTGKTSLVDALRARGRLCFDEPVRKTLMMQLAVDGPALPAKNPGLFVREMLRACIEDRESAHAHGGPAFFDRGIPDLIAYAVRFGVDPADFTLAARNNPYAESVFVLPPWREIFVHDEVRRASYEAYTEFHAMIEKSYRDLGYRLVEVPKVDIASRVRFIEDRVGNMNPN